MSMTESGASEARQQIERWIEESQGLLGRMIPSVLEDNQRLRDRVNGAEQDCDRMREEVAGLRRELGTLQSELETLRGQHDDLRAERVAVGEALSRALHHMSQMMQPMNDMVTRLQVAQPFAMETIYR
jgi:chromosome segregation ATPase